MKKFLLTTLLVLVTVVAAFAQNELTVTHQYNSRGTTNTFDVKDDAGNVIVTLTPAKNGGSNAPSCNYNDGELRLYTKNTLTIAAKDGYYIQRIDFTGCASGKFFDSGYKFSNGAIVGTISYPNASWAASDANTQSVVFTQTSTTGKQTHISKIVITYTKAGPVDVTPTFKDYTTTFTPGVDQFVTVEATSPANFIANAGDLTYTSNSDAIKVTEDKKLQIVKPVTDAVITVKWGKTDKYNEGNATFKVSVDKAPHGLKFKATSDELFADNEAPAFVSLENPNGLAVEYTSSDENVAAVIDGELMLGAPGVTTITATTEGNEIYAAGEASYTLTVVQVGLPGTPAFSFENDGYYKINESLIITPAAEGDEIYYKVGDGEYKLYTAPISFDAAEVYTVSAYAKNDKGQSNPTEISFLIEMLEYTGKFKDVEGELVLGDTRELEVELEGAKIADFNVTFTPETGILLPIPATQNKYYIVGAGDVTFTATAKVDADLYNGAITKTYTIKPKMEKSEGDATLVFDFSDVTNIGFTTNDFTNDNSSNALVFNNGVDPELGGINRTVDRGDGVIISFKKNSGQNNVRIMESANKLVVYADQADARNGSSFIVNGKNITKIELLEDATSYNGKFTTAVGTMGNLNTTTKVYTWTCETPVPSVEFVNKTNKQIRIHTITVYCTAVTEVAKEFKPYELTLAGSDYEIGEAMPHAVLPEGCTAPVSYLVNDEEEPAYATKHFSEASVKIVAHTPGFGDYLPSVSEAFNIAPLPINLPNQLTIHYSQGDGINMEGFKTVKGENGVYVFENIPVIGYDARVADKNYGHVFFSFYNVESTPAAAPRRAAAETDWSEVNNVVTYTPAEHRTVSGLNDEIELVRNKANTINGLPNVLCVPSAHETGKDVTFTVELKDDGTPSKVKLAEGTQTGVESVGVDADGEAEYYTLQGVRVAKPAAGIYLRRQGGTVSKVLVK